MWRRARPRPAWAVRFRERPRQEKSVGQPCSATILEFANRCGSIGRNNERDKELNELKGDVRRFANRLRFFGAVKGLTGWTAALCRSETRSGSLSLFFRFFNGNPK